MSEGIRSYVTRGAVLYCSCGSHSRCINLYYDHGWGIDMAQMDDEKKKTHPFMLSCDSIVDEGQINGKKTQNITWFGVCEGNVTGTESVVLKPDERMGGTKNVSGKKCKPKILGEWQNCKEDFIVDSMYGKGSPLTSESFLVCCHGGYIKILEGSDGNHYGFAYQGDKDKENM